MEARKILEKQMNEKQQKKLNEKIEFQTSVSMNYGP